MISSAEPGRDDSHASDGMTRQLDECAMAETSNQWISNVALWCLDSFHVLLLGYCRDFHVVGLKTQNQSLRTHACGSPVANWVELFHHLAESFEDISSNHKFLLKPAPSPYPPGTPLPKILPRSLPSLSWSLEKPWSSTSFLPLRLSKRLSAIWMLKDAYQHAALLRP